MPPRNPCFVSICILLSMGGGCSDASSTPSQDGGPLGDLVALSDALGEESRCGDGLLDLDEQCDDGNRVFGDGCDATCAIEGRVKDLALGVFHSCALLEGGKVRCWGHNSDGQLGTATTKGKTNTDIGDDEPASAGKLVDLGGKALQLAAGMFHTCALLEGGKVRCWGWGHLGQLGNGKPHNIGDDEHPAAAGDLPAGGKVAQVSALAHHSCILLQGGQVRCFGRNDNLGQLGYGHKQNIGDDETVAQAGDIQLGLKARQVFVGGVHNCALLADDSHRCWGFGGDGSLGVGSKASIGDDELPKGHLKPVQLGEPVLRLYAGGRHTCAVVKDRKLRCWGYGATGGLGYGNKQSIGDDELPSAVGHVDVGQRVHSLALGVENTCAVLDGGAVRCFGPNLDGQLGLGHTKMVGDDEKPSSVPTVGLGGPVLRVVAGSLHFCAIMKTGAVRCWGSNKYGQLGYGHKRPIGDDELPSSAGDVPLFAK